MTCDNGPPNGQAKVRGKGRRARVSGPGVFCVVARATLHATAKLEARSRGQQRAASRVEGKGKGGKGVSEVELSAYYVVGVQYVGVNEVRGRQQWLAQRYPGLWGGSVGHACVPAPLRGKKGRCGVRGSERRNNRRLG